MLAVALYTDNIITVLFQAPLFFYKNKKGDEKNARCKIYKGKSGKRKRNMECDVDRFNEEDLKFRKAKLKNDELNALKNRLNGKENAEKMKDADEKRKKYGIKFLTFFQKKSLTELLIKTMLKYSKQK